ncbi:MAG: DUF5684 domain-containing protein [Bacilli bacterium]|nr:DUF5684 domain-containing protein [Bacilli bacterium]
MIDYNFGLGALWGALGGFIIFIFLILVGILIFEIIATWKFFQKCGKNGWEAIIPIYNSWIKVEIAGLNWWWFLLLIFSVIVQVSGSDDYRVLIGIVPLFANFVCNYNLARKFHQDTGFAILMTLFSWIMIPIMAFSEKYQYDSSVVVSKNGIFKDNPNDDNSFQSTQVNTNQNVSYCMYCGTKLNENDKFCPNCGKEK